MKGNKEGQDTKKEVAEEKADTSSSSDSEDAKDSDVEMEDAV